MRIYPLLPIGTIAGTVAAGNDVRFGPVEERIYTATALNETPPADAVGVYVDLCAGGGGGGSGRRGAAGTIRTGGGGGGSGGYIHSYYLPVTWFGATYAAIVGAGGGAGIAVAVDDTNGNAGGTGGHSSLESGGNVIQCFRGGPGMGGSAIVAGGGYAGGITGVKGSNSDGAGGAGGYSSVIGSDTSGGSSGGGITALNVPSNGAAGRSVPYSPNGGVEGIAGGAAPTSGDASAYGPGSASGSGAGNIGVAGQDAAATPGYSAGGGGGGASENGFSSGAGSMGGPGFVIVRFIFN